MELKELIVSIASLMSITGYESYSKSELEDLIGGEFDESYADKIGNRFFVKRCGRENAPKILIDAHMDEIGLMVTDIKDGGFLTVTNVGGVDPRIMEASDVVIYGKEKIFGVVGAMPPHLKNKSEADTLKPISELIIDTGYTKEKLETLVRIGTPVGFAPKYATLANGKLAGKGFDDKACAACAVAGISRVAREDLAGDVYLMLSSREETGNPGGASPGAYAIDPDYAMVIDVNLGKTPDTPRNETVDMGGGASILYCPITDRKLTNMLFDEAKDKGIKVQPCVASNHTGTNTPDIHLVRGGIPCVDVGLPLKSMHTCAEVLELSDAEQTAALTAAFISSNKIAEVFAR